MFERRLLPRERAVGREVDDTSAKVSRAEGLGAHRRSLNRFSCYFTVEVVDRPDEMRADRGPLLTFDVGASRHDDAEVFPWPSRRRLEHMIEVVRVMDA